MKVYNFDIFKTLEEAKEVKAKKTKEGYFSIVLKYKNKSVTRSQYEQLYLWKNGEFNIEEMTEKPFMVEWSYDYDKGKPNIQK